MMVSGDGDEGSRRTYLRVMVSGARWPDASRAASAAAFPVCCCFAAAAAAAVGAIDRIGGDPARRLSED